MAESVVRAGASDRVLTMSELAEAMRACFPSEDVLRCAEIQIEVGGLLEMALRVSGTSMGMVSRLTNDQLRLLVQRGLTAQAVELIDGLPAGPESACGRAVLEKNRVVIPDMDASDNAAFREIARTIGFRAVHAVPLIALDGDPLGVLATLFIQSHEVIPAEARDIDEVAGRMAPLIARLA